MAELSRRSLACLVVCALASTNAFQEGGMQNKPAEKRSGIEVKALTPKITYDFGVLSKVNKSNFGRVPADPRAKNPTAFDYIQIESVEGHDNLKPVRLDYSYRNRFIASRVKRYLKNEQRGNAVVYGYETVRTSGAIRDPFDYSKESEFQSLAQPGWQARHTFVITDIVIDGKRERLTETIAILTAEESVDELKSPTKNETETEKQ